MRVRLFRRLFAIVIAMALMGAPAVQATITQPCDTVAASVSDHQLLSGQTPAPTPCKGMMPGCPDMLGCTLSAGLPTYAAAMAQELIWIPIAYRAITDAREGLSVKPDLGPPITI
jgi:hypothetical protein